MERWRRDLRLLGLAAIAAAVLSMLHSLTGDLLWARRLETTMLDFMVRLRGPLAPGPEIAVIVIDDDTLARERSWPLPRRRYADMLDLLRRSGARVVAFDILFSDAEKPPAEAIALLEAAGLPEQAQALAQRAGGDNLFAAAIERFGAVVLPFSFRFGSDEAGPAPAWVARSAYASLRSVDERAELRLAPTGVLAPVAPLGEAAAGLGHVLVAFDVDGAPRFDYPVIEQDLDYYPSLPIRVAQLYLGIPWQDVVVELGRGVRVGSHLVPTDAAMRLAVDYIGPAGTFPTYSFGRLLAGEVPDLKDRIVLIGADVVGVHDTFRTPFTSVYPGVERLATIIDSILHDRHLRRPEIAPVVEIAAIAAAALAIGALVARSPLPVAALGTLVVLAALDLAGYLAYARAGLWFSLALPTLALVGVFTFLSVTRYVLLDRDLRAVRGAFSRYLSPAMVERVARSPEKLRLGGELRELTILFCDVRGFTGLSERLDPEALTRVINGFLEPMSEIVFEHGGTVDKYTGDGIMAFWNAPLDQPDHVERACRAALAMQATLAPINRGLPPGAGPLAAGIGINTGPCLVGNFGSSRRLEYSAVGDAVNIAARLQELTRSYDAAILIGPETASRVPAMTPRLVGTVQLRGRAGALDVYAIDAPG